MMAKTWVRVAGVLIPVLLLAACSSGGGGSEERANPAVLKLSKAAENPTDVCTKDHTGGKLRYRSFPEGAGMDPVVSQSNAMAAEAIYGTLIRWNAEAHAFEGDLAKSMSSNDDGTVWTLSLRDNVTYPGGKPLDAAAVKKNVERYLDPKFPSPFSARVAQIKNMEVKDPQTLIFTLKDAWGTFPWLFTQNVGMIINPAVLDSTPAVKLAAAPPANAGAGAFTFASATRGQSITFKGKSDWSQGPVCLDGLVLSFSTVDTGADYEALQAGQLDGFYTYDTAVVKRVMSDKTLTAYGLPGYVGSTIFVNTTRPPFDDAKVRKALSLSLDRKLINSRIYKGLSLPDSTIVPSSFTDQPDVRGLPFNEAEAKSLLQGAAKKSFAYTFVPAASNQNLAILQQALAKKVGFDAKLDGVQISDFVQKVYASKNFDGAQSSINMDESCVYCALDQLQTGNALNVSSYSSPEFDRKLAALKAAKPGAETTEALTSLQKFWNDEMPGVITTWLPSVAALSTKVHGLSTSTSSTAPDFSKVYIAN